MSTSGASASTRRRPRDRKQQIMVAARDLFIEKGFPNVTMAQIAARVGITAGALYRHFSNKAVLLEEVIAENFAWVDEPAIRQGYVETTEDAIARIVDRPYLSDLWTHEIRYLPEDKRRDLLRRMSEWNGSLIHAVRRQRPDLDPGQEELVAWAVQSLLSCIGRRSMHSPAPIRLAAVRAGLRSLATARLVPTGEEVPGPGSGPRLLPVSMRERLLMAAHEQFGDRGYQETSMASLGAAADVTGPNLYIYFDNKADVLRAVLERATHSLWLSLEEALASSSTAAEVLSKLVRAYIGTARSWAAAIEDPTGEFELEETSTAAQREYVAEWVALLRQVFPDLGPREAPVRVQIALFLVSDLHRNPRLASRESFRENLAGLVRAVLFDGDEQASLDA